MADHPVPPEGIGLLAGLLTTTVLVALSAVTQLPFWASAPLLLLGGGIAAGIAAPVRPPAGALIGAATGLFAAVLLVVLESLYSIAAFGQPPATHPLKLFSLIVIASVPLYTLSGAFGAAVRRKIAGPDADGEYRCTTIERHVWLGIALGALFIIGIWASTTGIVPGWRLWPDAWFLAALILLYAFTSGLVAALFSRGGMIGALRSSLFAIVCSLGILVGLMILQDLTVTRNLYSGLWPIAVAIYAIVGIPAAVLGGIVGGILMKPFAVPPVSADCDAGGQDVPDAGRRCDGN
ncbi:MAG: hypothetical protein ABFC89_03325 [Methanospirillum sp.]